MMYDSDSPYTSFSFPYCLIYGSFSIEQQMTTYPLSPRISFMPAKNVFFTSRSNSTSKPFWHFLMSLLCRIMFVLFQISCLRALIRCDITLSCSSETTMPHSVKTGNCGSKLVDSGLHIHQDTIQTYLPLPFIYNPYSSLVPLLLIIFFSSAELKR